MNSKGNLSKYGENMFIGESLKEILNPMKEETTKQHPWAVPMIECAILVEQGDNYCAILVEQGDCVIGSIQLDTLQQQQQWY